MPASPPDKKARFLEAYAVCHPAIQRYCHALAYDRADVEDLLQDILLSAFRHFDELGNAEKLQHYLLRAARNRAISLGRKRRRRGEWTERNAEHLRAGGATGEQLADVHLLYRAIDKLPEAQRQAILLFEIADRPLKEVAEQLGKSPAAVKMLLQRGRAGLRKRLTDRGTSPAAGELALATLFLTAKLLTV